jgi:phage terminase large subunit-like protein
MRKAVWAYTEFRADSVVVEANNGGDYLPALLRTIDQNVPCKTVRASRGKVTRAEPVSALYEQRRMHHVGVFAQLEDQMVTWVPSDPDSPDRVDALVWGCSELRGLSAVSWLDAYGVIECEGCGKHIPHVEGRLRCPHCGLDLPGAEPHVAAWMP